MNCNNKLFKINLVQFILCFKYQYRTDIGPICYVDIAYYVLTHHLKLSFSTMNCNNKLFKINFVQCVKTVYFWF